MFHQHKWDVLERVRSPHASYTQPFLNQERRIEFVGFFPVFEHVKCEACGREHIRKATEVRDFAPDQYLYEREALT